MKAAFWQALCLLALSVAAAAIAQRFHPRAPALYLADEPVADNELTVEMVYELEKERGGIFWIDARSREAYEKEHVPGARLLNMQEFDALLPELFDDLSRNEWPIVVYCDSQQCDLSHQVAERLDALGLQEIYVLKGGWPAWKSARRE